MNSYLVVRRYQRSVVHLTMYLILCIGIVLCWDGFYLWGRLHASQGQKMISKSCVPLRGDYRFRRYMDLVRAVHNMPVAEACAVRSVRIQRVHDDYVVHIV